MQELVSFLHTNSLLARSFEEYVDGLKKLEMIEVDDGGLIYKHNSIFNQAFFIQLVSNYSPDNSALSIFLEQISLFERDISTDDELNSTFEHPLGFWGIDFSHTSINTQRQIVDDNSFKLSRSVYLRQCIKQSCFASECLKRLFPWATFENSFWDDFDYVLNSHNQDLSLDRLIDLIADIPEHPFVGGEGKTEPLKYGDSACASKRFSQEHRLVYQGILGSTGKFIIHRCLYHYK